METTVSQEPPATSSEQPTLVRGLSLLDSVLLLAGGIIGSSIFLTAKDIAGPLPSTVLFLAVWVFGALISLCAAFALAEMGSMFPSSGGQYVFLREAFGDLIAFLYGWMLFAVANGGSIAALSVAAAVYLGGIFPAISQEHVLLSVAGVTVTRAHVVALLAIAVVTWINVIGLRRGAILANIATWAKFAAMGTFIVLGFAIGKGNWANFTAAPSGAAVVSSTAAGVSASTAGVSSVAPGVAAASGAASGATGVSGAAGASGASGLMAGMSLAQLISALGVGLIAVFWAYDGWVYVTWVAGEIKNPQRNVPRAMVLGIIVVAVIYISMNLTYVYAMPLSEIAKHETIAAAAAEKLFSPKAAVWLAATIALACFGASASCTLSGARVYYAMAKDGVFFRRMAEIHPKYRTPALSLIGQGLWASVLTLSGRYDQLYTYVIYGMVLSYTLTVVGLFILRKKRPDMPRPYRCTGYPWLPAIYVLLGSWWTINTIVTRPKEALVGTVIVLLGVPGYLYWKRSSRKETLAEHS